MAFSERVGTLVGNVAVDLASPQADRLVDGEPNLLEELCAEDKTEVRFECDRQRWSALSGCRACAASASAELTVAMAIETSVIRLNASGLRTLKS